MRRFVILAASRAALVVLIALAVLPAAPCPAAAADGDRGRDGDRGGDGDRASDGDRGRDGDRGGDGDRASDGDRSRDGDRGRDRGGLPELVVRSAIEGATVGGMLGYALFADAGVPHVVAGALGGGVAGAALPLWLASGRDVRSGDVVWISAAEIWGLVAGFGAPLAFQLRRDSAAAAAGLPYGIDRDDRRLDLGIAAAASVAAGAAAAWAAPRLAFTPGQAAMIGSGVLWGGAAGALAVLAVAPEARSPAWNEAAVAAAIVGSTGGALAAWGLRHGSFDVDRARAVALDVGAVAGAGVGLLVALLFDHHLEDDRLVAGALLAGGALGGGAGWWLSRGVDDFTQGAARGQEALPGPRAGGWAIGLPAPRPFVTASSGGARVTLGLSLAMGAL